MSKPNQSPDTTSHHLISRPVGLLWNPAPCLAHSLYKVQHARGGHSRDVRVRLRTEDGTGCERR